MDKFRAKLNGRRKAREHPRVHSAAETIARFEQCRRRPARDSARAAAKPAAPPPMMTKVLLDTETSRRR